MRAFAEDKIPFHPPPSALVEILMHVPLDLEIGAGQGLHAVSYCRRFPQRKLIAVERTSTRFHQLNRRHQAHPDTTNLYPIHADAVSVVTHWLKDKSLEKVFLLYPNPYPKSKQANLRWHNMPFMRTLIAKMATGAELTLSTNVESYALEAREKFTTLWGLILKSHERLTTTSIPRTHFEKKYLERGEPCWNLVFQKA